MITIAVPHHETLLCLAQAPPVVSAPSPPVSSLPPATPTTALSSPPLGSLVGSSSTAASIPSTPPPTRGDTPGAIPTQPSATTVPVVAAWIAAIAAIIAAFIAGAFAIAAKRVEIEVKQLEIAGQAAKELLLSDLSTQRDGLQLLRNCLQEARRAASQWVLALYYGRKDKPAFDEALRLSEVLVVTTARAPVKYRADLETDANKLVSALHWIFDDARDDHNYHQDDDLCSEVEQKIVDSVKSLAGKLDAWEGELLAERERMYAVLRDAASSRTKEIKKRANK